MTRHDQHRPAPEPSNTRRVLQAAGLGAAIALAVPACAAEHTVSVVERVQLAVAPARVWAAIQDFNAWQTWHPAFASTEVVRGDGHSQGTVRALIARDGGRFIEELTSFDAASRSYKYRIMESPAPVADYVSTIEVRAVGTGSAVVWSSNFKVKPGTSEADARALISGVYRAGLDNLAAVVK
jgi:mxaD protein